MSAVHLLDGFETTPSIDQPKIRLEAAVIQVDRFDGSRSTSRGQSSSHRQAASSKRQSSHYGISNERSRPYPPPHEQPVRPARIQHNPTQHAHHRINEIQRGRTQATPQTREEIGDHSVPNPDAFPCFTREIHVHSFPCKFKTSGINNYDGKIDLNIWL